MRRPLYRSTPKIPPDRDPAGDTDITDFLLTDHLRA